MQNLTEHILLRGQIFHLQFFFGTADFSNTRYTGPADFSLSTFKGETIFIQASFKKQGADFSHTKFLGGVNLKNIISAGKINFNSTEFVETLNLDQAVSRSFQFAYALFSCKSPPSSYIFSVQSWGGGKIETKQISTTDGRVFTIPVGCELFDPEPLSAPKPEEDNAE